jgi:hypothetical protein
VTTNDELHVHVVEEKSSAAAPGKDTASAAILLQPGICSPESTLMSKKILTST